MMLFPALPPGISSSRRSSLGVVQLRGFHFYFPLYLSRIVVHQTVRERECARVYPFLSHCPFGPFDT